MSISVGDTITVSVTGVKAYSTDNYTLSEGDVLTVTKIRPFALIVTNSRDGLVVALFDEDNTSTSEEIAANLIS